MFNALSIAGSDSSGGAGIQADLKTFSANGVYAMSVITSITAQNTQGIIHIKNLDTTTVEKQIEAIFDDIKVNCIKIGMLGNSETINIIIDTLKKYKIPPIVLDPVMISTSGKQLIDKNAKKILINKLFPMSKIITPNIPEAEDILKIKITNVEDMKAACIKLFNLGPEHVLLKGGHLKESACDILYDGNNFALYDSIRINNINTHGTGCTLSSAICANLSKGYNTENAVYYAKKYITLAIKNGIRLGKGIGPTNHFYYMNDNNINQMLYGEYKNEFEDI